MGVHLDRLGGRRRPIGRRWTPIGRRSSRNGRCLRASCHLLRASVPRRQDVDRIRLDSDLLLSARALVPSVQDRGGQDEDRFLFAEAAGRQKTVPGGREKVLHRLEKDRVRPDEDRLSLAPGRRRFVASVSRFDRVVGQSARELLLSAATPVLSAKALLLSPKAGFTSPKAGFSSTKAILAPALESASRPLAPSCPFNGANRDSPPRFLQRRVRGLRCRGGLALGACRRLVGLGGGLQSGRRLAAQGCPPPLRASHRRLPGEAGAALQRHAHVRERGRADGCAVRQADGDAEGSGLRSAVTTCCLSRLSAPGLSRSATTRAEWFPAVSRPRASHEEVA